VAEHAGEIVGYCLAARATYPPVFRTQEYGMIYDMAVSAQRRREGIGELLFGEVRRWFESRGIRRIELRVLPANKLSTSFWKKQGFRPFLETLYREI
jgi:GNAT superfamily N-acetyltransferase